MILACQKKQQVPHEPQVSYVIIGMMSYVFGYWNMDLSDIPWAEEIFGLVTYWHLYKSKLFQRPFLPL